ncbi:MAG: ABC transporter ATP-binding protein [Betaproteobacteria bacterium TMED156]|nr:MAG: ABC transporter ATP-binding protein [Betaproteobacteria bacterium TMED156]|tara:strand:+ start:612 stop:1331 length:720 start_codon:yes stop_codon:yes gene_type:complete
MKTLIKIDNLSINYGGIKAVRNISFSICEGEKVSLIGANGAGKSTTLKGICGLIIPVSGTILFKGNPINHLPANERTRLGIVLVPEGRGIFSRMTVLENLQIGAFSRQNKDLVLVKDEIELQLIQFPRLKERISQLAGTLSGGEQQMLAISRALMSKPNLLLLDEPSMGLAPLLVDQIFEVINSINKQGITVFVVEQNAKRALEITDKAIVMDSGEIIKTGSSSSIIDDPKVRKAYLGI